MTKQVDTGMIAQLNKRQLDAFVNYASVMEKVKKRIAKIELVGRHAPGTREDSEDRVEALATELKRILEDLPYSCLGLKIPNLGRRASWFRKSRPLRLIKAAADGERLMPTPLRGPSPPFVVLDAAVPSSDCMNSEQWESAWAWCNRFAHSRNPASERPELTSGDLETEWGVGIRFVQRVVNLLDIHFVVAKGPMDLHGTVRMAAGQPPTVIVQVAMRATPWEPEIKVGDGTVIRLERKNRDGTWRRASDGSEGGISLHQVVGHCTRNGFLRAGSR